MAIAFAEKHPDDGPREKPAAERANDAKELERKTALHKQQLEQQVADLIVARIAHPRGFLRVDAHHLFADRFRVNVLATKEVPDCYGEERSISKSFFVQSDGVKLMRSIPPLE